MSNENKQNDERAAEADMRAAFLQQMGEPWETALDAKRRIWSLAWGASRFYAHQAQLDERAAFEAWAIKEGLDVLPSPHWANTTFHSLPTEDSWRGWQARATQQATTGDERAADDYPETQDSVHAAQLGVLEFHLRRVVLTYEAGDKAKVPLATVIEGVRDFLVNGGWKRNNVRLFTTPSPVAGSAGQAPITDEQRHALQWAADRAHVESLGKSIGGVEGRRWRILLDLIRNSAAAPTAPSLATDAGAALSHSNEVAIAKQYDIDESLVRDLWREFAAMHSEQRMSDEAIRPAKSHCQNGGDVCLAGNRDGVCCPEDSCDIDDGTRKNPIDAACDAKDAARYRWLSRQAVASHSGDDLICRWEVDYLLRGESFSDAIDAARNAEIERSGGEA